MVPLKELQEAGLGARGSLDTAETQVVARTLQVAHVHGQVLQPQTGPLSHGGQLGRPASGTGGEGGGGETSALSRFALQKSRERNTSQARRIRRPPRGHVRTHW